MDPAPVLARIKLLVDAGREYEAHQQVVARARRSKDVSFSINLLQQGAKLLLDAGRIDSGVDITIELVNLLTKKSIKPDESNRTIIASLFRAMPITQPSVAKLVSKVTDWSISLGEYPAGDPEIHDVVGDLYASAGEVYKAESHLLVGAQSSITRLAQIEYDWYREDQPDTAGAYIGRAVIPYLLLGNVPSASLCLRHFYSLLDSDSTTPKPASGAIPAQLANIGMRVYPDMPLLNFISFLVATVSRKDPPLYTQLRGQYKSTIAESPMAEKWIESLDQIGEGYFGIRQQMPSNPLFDMMGSFFEGAGGSGGLPGFGGSGPRQLPGLKRESLD